MLRRRGGHGLRARSLIARDLDQPLDLGDLLTVGVGQPLGLGAAGGHACKGLRGPGLDVGAALRLGRKSTLRCGLLTRCGGGVARGLVLQADLGFEG